MKRIFTILILTLMMLLGAYAAPINETAGKSQDKEQSAVVDTNKAAGQAVVEKGTEQTEATEEIKKDVFNNSEAEENLSSMLPLISAIVAALALAFAVYVFFFSKSKYEELYDRYRKVKGDVKSLEAELNSSITRRIDSNNAKVDSKVSAIKEQILEEIKTAQQQKDEAEIKTAEVREPEPPKFISKTIFGIYKSKVKGVVVDQTTEMREGNSTLEIVTVSDNEAEVHLVDNLTKTQFSGLNGDAVLVIEGNPQSYDTISEVEAGRMELNEDIWTLTQPIKVNLS